MRVAQLCPTLCDPVDTYRPLNSPGQVRILEWVAFPSPGNLPNPGIKPRSPALQVDSLPGKPQGKHKHTGVGSLSLLQWIFLTQELNWGLLHCSQILYQLSYQGSPSRYLPREVKNTTCKDLYINDYNTFISGSKKMGEKSKHPTTRVKGKWSHSVMSNSLWPHGLLRPWDSPGKNTGVDCHFLLQGIFLTQGLNPGLQHWRQML